jgi:hypothetical protein
MSPPTTDFQTLTLPLEIFLARINRRLHKLIPYRELFFDTTKRDYYIRVINHGNVDHLITQGPYYYRHMIGLARHLDIFTPSERLCSPILLKSRSGFVHQEAGLPGHLKFDVLTPVLHDALMALRGKGWTIEPPVAAPQPAPVGALTATVTAPVPEPEEDIDVDLVTGEPL